MIERPPFAPVLILLMTALVVLLGKDPAGRSTPLAGGPPDFDPSRHEERSAGVGSTSHPGSDSATRTPRIRDPAGPSDPTFGSRSLPAPVRLETPVPFPEVTRRRLRERVREVLTDYGYASERDSFDLGAARTEIRRRLTALDAKTASDRIAANPYRDLLGPLPPILGPVGADRSDRRLVPLRTAEDGKTSGPAVPEPGFWSTHPTEIPDTAVSSSENGL